MLSGLSYLRAVLRHSVALVTGSLPTALYTVLILGFPDTPGRTQHYWNHIPPSVVLPLTLLGVVWAQYLTWRDVWRRRGLPDRPSLPRGLELEQYSDIITTKFTLTSRGKDLNGLAVRLSCDGPISAKGFVPQYVGIRRKYRYLGDASTVWEGSQQVTRKRGDIIMLPGEEAERLLKEGKVERDTRPPDVEEFCLVDGEWAQNGDIRNEDVHTVIFDFSGERFRERPFATISGYVVSTDVPIRVCLVEWVKDTLRKFS